MAEEFSIHTSTVGETGETVVFLHGLFGQGKNFTQIAKGLEPEFQSVLVDLPNHGASDWTESFDYVDQADLVAEHLRRTVAADEPINLVGHSMGGKISMVLALRHPELVRRLAVVDISPIAHKDMGEFEHLLDSLLQVPLDEISTRSEAGQQLREPIPEDMVRGFLLQSLVRSDDGFRWKNNLKLLRQSLPQIADFPYDPVTDDAAETDPANAERPQYTGPVRWIAGAKSNYIKEEYAPAMRALFPRVRQITVKNAGHWVHAEQREVFTQILQRFLSSKE